MMKRLTNLYGWLLVIVFIGVMVYTPLGVLLGTRWPHYMLWFKSWKELVLLVAMLLGVLIVTRRKLWGELFRDLVVQLIAVYTVLHILLAVIMPHTVETLLAGLAADLRYILFFGLVYVLIKVAPGWRSRFLRAGLVGAVIVIGFAALETVLPHDLLTHIGYSKMTIVPYLTVDQNPNFIRYGSTLRGPNPLGAFAIVTLAMVAALLARTKLNLKRRSVLATASLITACSVIALWVSYSRSAAIGAVVALVFIGARELYTRGHLTRRNWFYLGAAVLVCIVGAAAVWKSNFVSNVILHENPHGGSSISSNAGHLESLTTGVVRLLAQPIGAGIGSTGSASLYGSNGLIIENQYLFIAHEAGWLGLILFAALFILVMVRLWRVRHDWLALGVFASGLGLTIVGLLLPVWADDTIGIVWWGLAALALGGRRGK